LANAGIVRLPELRTPGLGWCALGIVPPCRVVFGPMPIRNYLVLDLLRDYSTASFLGYNPEYCAPTLAVAGGVWANVGNVSAASFGVVASVAKAIGTHRSRQAD
jgi:hypothetical protein